MNPAAVSPKNNPRALLAGASIFVLLLAALWVPGGHAQGPAPVTTDTVLQQAFTQTVPIIGRLIAKQSGDAATRIDGVVSALPVEVGDRVTRGQALVSLDTTSLALRLRLAEAQHTEAEARLKTANAQLTLADQEAKRLSGLADSAAISRAAYDDAKQRHNIAFARVQEAAAAITSSEAEVNLAKLARSYAEITAPFDGVITDRLTEIGSYLQRGQAVMRLISDRRLELEADIPSNRLDGLSAGVEVEILLDNGSAHRATVRAVVPEEDPRTRTRRVRFSADLGTDAGLLAAEQSVTVLVPAGAQRDIVSVHKDAIVQRGRDTIVFVVVDGAATIRDIRTGEASGDRIEVLDGLRPGELTVVRGNERLQPGQKVVISNPQ